MSEQSTEKLVIIGSGPAGWTAAIYAARAVYKRGDAVDPVSFWDFKRLASLCGLLDPLFLRLAVRSDLRGHGLDRKRRHDRRCALCAAFCLRAQAAQSVGERIAIRNPKRLCRKRIVTIRVFDCVIV